MLVDSNVRFLFSFFFFFFFNFFVNIISNTTVIKIVAIVKENPCVENISGKPRMFPKRFLSTVGCYKLL